MLVQPQDSHAMFAASQVVCTVKGLMQYSVESSSFFNLFYSRFVCTRRSIIDKIGIFHENQTSMCLDPHQKLEWGWYRQTCLSPSVIFLLAVPLRCFFCIYHFCYLCFVFDFVILFCLFLAALWSPAGKGLTSWLSYVWCFLAFCHFPIRCPGSGVVLDRIDSWSLLSSFKQLWYHRVFTWQIWVLFDAINH